MVARLSALDASFLRVETPSAHMHVGWVSTLELPAGAERLDAEALTESVAARLHLAPRFRQRIATVPLSLGEAVWEDDPAFDVARHVRVVEPPEPLGSCGLRELVGDFLSEQLDRSRPLWEIVVVPKLGPGRAAILGKVHHAMVDGIAAVELGIVLFDVAPEAAPTDPQDWDPEPAAGAVRLAVDAVADGALEQFRAAGRTARAGLSPRSTLRMAGTLRRAAVTYAEGAISPAPPTYLNVPIGPRRALARHRVPIARLLALKRVEGVTLNDVVLTVVAGALRRFALDRGEAPRDLRVMIPVSLRQSGDQGAGGNRITFGFIDLPVSRPDTAERLETVHERTDELKRSGRIAGSETLLRSVAMLPAPLKDRAARLAASPRLYNLTVSNVPGPRFPLYAAGARVSSIYPVIPIPDHHALSIGVLTYDDAVHFAVYSDPEALPRAGRLTTLLDDALTELEIASGRVRPGSSARRRAGPAVARSGGGAIRR